MCIGMKLDLCIVSKGALDLFCSLLLFYSSLFLCLVVALSYFPPMNDVKKCVNIIGSSVLIV